jgi:mannose-6-phosphate isomerase
MGRTTEAKRPWGRWERFTANEKTTVKLMYIKKGGRLSYQYHLHRAEFWKVVSGKVKVTLNGRTKILEAGDTSGAPLKAKHRIEGLKDSIILEIAHGDYNENDIVRLQDDYNRKINNKK